MKKLFIGITLLFSFTAWANCEYSLDTNSFELQRYAYEAHGTIEKIMNEKGYIYTPDKDTADLVVDLSVEVETLDAKENLVTFLKDQFDGGNEADAFLTTKRTTSIKVSNSTSEVLSGKLSTVSKSLNGINAEEKAQVEKGLKEAVFHLSSLKNC